MQNSCNRFYAAILFAALACNARAETAIVSRAQWQAKPAIGEMKSQKPNAILVHHTGSPMKPKSTLLKKMQGLQRFSQAREKLADGRIKPAWPDVPYHFYVDVNGDIAEGRSIEAVGDTNTGYDPTGFIQVVVEGNFETEKVTAAQEAALKTLLQNLMKTYAISSTTIKAHNEKAQTACPGKDLADKLKGIVKQL
jgi:N-acetylmuramoyl-L-alanine amidase